MVRKLLIVASERYGDYAKKIVKSTSVPEMATETEQETILFTLLKKK